jgi:iron complex transport system substrate-binding protein
VVGPPRQSVVSDNRGALVFAEPWPSRPSASSALTEATVETLYLLGEEKKRIVRVSGYAVRPSRVRTEKPRVSAFTSANVSKILALEPDLVLTFSDLQAEIVATLIREGVQVHAFNQRTVAGILDMVTPRRIRQHPSRAQPCPA